jgi:hypothetical protein
MTAPYPKETEALYDLSDRKNLQLRLLTAECRRLDARLAAIEQERRQEWEADYKAAREADLAGRQHSFWDISGCNVIIPWAQPVESEAQKARREAALEEEQRQKRERLARDRASLAAERRQDRRRTARNAPEHAAAA